MRKENTPNSNIFHIVPMLVICSVGLNFFHSSRISLEHISTN